MEFGALIETGIGLMLMFLVLSLFATAIIESISQFFALRARNLKRAVEALLSGQTTKTADGEEPLATAFANHPLSKIADSMEVARSWFGSSKHGPSHIDKESFLSTLRAVASGAQSLSDAIDKLPDGDVKKALSALRAQAIDTGAKLDEVVGKWFDSMMERASGVFQRWMRTLAIVVGFILALALNADTLEVGQKLAGDPAMRAAFVDLAEKRVECQKRHGAGAKECDDPKKLWGEIKSFTVGWTQESLSQAFSSIGNVVLKFLGLLLTGFAVALGAPFWFDLLSKVLGMRIKASGEDVDKQRSGQRK
jgi:hypothetical protein